MFLSRLLFCNGRPAFFNIPSLMEATSFVRLANNGGSLLKDQLIREELAKSSHLISRAYREEVERVAHEKCSPLLNLNISQVEKTVFEKYDLYSIRVPTCLVPYRVATNIILSLLPSEVRAECIKELKLEEKSREDNLPPPASKYITWKDDDIYTSTGLNYLRRVYKEKKRTPIFCVLGHVNHGKTTLVDALQGSLISKEEPHGITQNLRAFTIGHPSKKQNLFTFVDTPGHAVFVEARFHTMLICDFVLLVVSAVEGVHGQVHEAVKVALNVDRPVIVVFNKLDLFTDPFSMHTAVKKCITDLAAVGLDVTLAHDIKGSEKNSTKGGDALAVTENGKALSFPNPEVYFDKMKKIDPSYRGSRKSPVVELRRKCVGVCVSAKNKTNFPLLWDVLQKCVDSCPPMCYSVSPDAGAHEAAVQAVVFESSKHLFDEESFRLNSYKQNIQKRIDAEADKKRKKFDKHNVYIKARSSAFAVGRSFRERNRTSTPSLVLSVIVREGAVTRGMNFVADQAEGKVEAIMDFWGNSMECALPGMAVTLVDHHSLSGCPGVGTHVLSTKKESTRFRIHNYRRILQWYVEVFYNKLELLRPRGMDVSFSHLGDYGQLQNTETLEYQLLYGAPPGKTVDPILYIGSGSQPLYAYLADKCGGAGGAMVHSPQLAADDSVKRVDQSIFSPTEYESLQTSWDSLRLQTSIATEEEYREYIMQCMQIGVLIKVDSWHSARLIRREVSRLSTSKVFLQVVGVRFGGLTQDDAQYFGNGVKLALCYRVPLVSDPDVDKVVEALDWWVMQTDHIADLLAFVKGCVVSVHREHVDEEDDKNKRYPTLHEKEGEDDEEMEVDLGSSLTTKPARRSRKLLAFKPITD